MHTSLESPSGDVLTLFQWMSPSFPIGSFAYSHGLEWAISAGEVHDASTLRAWLEEALTHGTGRNDAILAAHALRGVDPAALAEIADALSPSRERAAETRDQGRAFCDVVSRLTGRNLPSMALPVALGHAARALDLPAATVIAVMLHAFTANLVSAGVRFMPLGQTEGQRVLRALHPGILALAHEALDASLDDLGGAFLRGDLASIRHETQTIRIFRS